MIAEDEAALDCGVNDHDGVTHLNSPTSLTCSCDFREKRECEAKRRIVELSWHHFGEDDYAWGMEEAKRQILAIMALPYADRPGYLEEWRP